MNLWDFNPAEWEASATLEIIANLAFIGVIVFFYIGSFTVLYYFSDFMSKAFFN